MIYLPSWLKYLQSSRNYIFGVGTYKYLVIFSQFLKTTMIKESPMVCIDAVKSVDNLFLQSWPELRMWGIQNVALGRNETACNKALWFWQQMSKITSVLHTNLDRYLVCRIHTPIVHADSRGSLKLLATRSFVALVSACLSAFLTFHKYSPKCLQSKATDPQSNSIHHGASKSLETQISNHLVDACAPLYLRPRVTPSSSTYSCPTEPPT